MTLSKSKLEDLIKSHEGLLLNQLYQMLPEDETPSYSTFTRQVKTLPGVHYSTIFAQASTKFVSYTRPKFMNVHRRKLLMVLAQIELMGKGKVPA